jgi:hypothetical protein
VDEKFGGKPAKRDVVLLAFDSVLVEGDSVEQSAKLRLPAL